MSKIYNGIFENSLRIVLMLRTLSSPQNLGRLCDLDFLTAYGKSFGITDTNINGTSIYLFSEYSARRSIVEGALSELVLDGLVYAKESDQGFLYSLTEEGEEYADSLSSPYASQYRNASMAVKAFASDKTDSNLYAFITSVASHSLRRSK